jgi:hypothetical protein
MKDDDQLIAQLKMLDSQQSASPPVIDPSRLVERVYRLRSTRRTKQRRMRMLAGGTLGLGLIAWVTWDSRQPDQAPHLPTINHAQSHEGPTVARQLEAATATPTHQENLLASSDAMKLELTRELELWRANHSQSLQDLQEIKTSLLREELSRRVIDLEVPSNLFF